MIFQHTIDKVLSGKKTQMRRVVIPRTVEPIDQDARGETDGEWFYNNTVWLAKPCAMGKGFWGLNYTQAKPKYRIGSTYAVQPGYGQKSVGRIKLTGIRKEDVRCISDEDVKAEGFLYNTEFLSRWASMYDRPFQFCFDPSIVDYRVWHDRRWDIVGYDTLLEMLASRPYERYQAWVLEFELVEKYV